MNVHLNNDSSKILTIDLDADSPNVLCKRQAPIQINCAATSP